MRPIQIERGQVLIEGALVDTDVSIADGVIAAVGEQGQDGALVIDASGLLVLPGIVDIHGDAFERQIMPRPGVIFPYPLALTDTDRQLVAAGITTAYHGLTLSWEPGLRSVDAALRFLEGLQSARPTLSADHRVQFRLETFAFEAEDIVARWLETVPAPALAFNDHTTSTRRKLNEGRCDRLQEWATRAELSAGEYLARLDEVWERRADVPDFIERMAASARNADVVMLSHDDRTEEERISYRDLGAAIAEFPMTGAAIDEASSGGDPTVLGAPNVVRGGSHTGALNAGDMIEAGKCTILASDYHYPSMLAAVGRLAETRRLSVEHSWSLISEAPARSLGLEDRGKIAPHLRADLILAAFDRSGLPRVIATLAGGKIVSLEDHDRLA